MLGTSLFVPLKGFAQLPFPADMNYLLLPKRLHALQGTFQVILKLITAKLSLAVSSGHHSGQSSVESWALV